MRTLGGDLGLVLPRGENDLYLLLADISGHGIRSALIANRIYAETITLLEDYAAPANLLRRLNRFVYEQIALPGFMFSMAVARLASEGRSLEFCGAGHPPGFIVSADGRSQRLESQGLVLDCLPDAIPGTAGQQFELHSGDRLMLYTDGFTEIFNLKGDILDVSGLETLARDSVAKPLAEMKQSILDGAKAWRHGPSRDDMSLVLLGFA